MVVVLYPLTPVLALYKFSELRLGKHISHRKLDISKQPSASEATLTCFLVPSPKNALKALAKPQGWSDWRQLALNPVGRIATSIALASALATSNWLDDLA